MEMSLQMVQYTKALVYSLAIKGTTLMEPIYLYVKKMDLGQVWGISVQLLVCIKSVRV